MMHTELYCDTLDKITGPFQPCSAQSHTKPFGDNRDYSKRRDWSVIDTRGPSYWRPKDSKGRVRLFTMRGAFRYAAKLNQEAE